LTPEILHDLQDMLKDFDAKNGSYKFNLHFGMVLCFDLMLHNGLQLPEGGDFEALHCQPSTNFDRSTKLDLTTEPPLLGRCC